MVNREEVREISPDDRETIRALSGIVGSEEMDNLLYGHIAEVDNEAANGYILEVVVRRKTTA